MDGNPLRDEIVERLAAELAALGSPPVCLATVLVGDDRPSQIYVRGQAQAGREGGPDGRGASSCRPRLARPRWRTGGPGAGRTTPAVHGILVQLPLPDGLDPEPVLDLVPPEKDVDGLTERSMGRLLRGRPGHVPCTPKGVMRLLERYGVGGVGSARRRRSAARRSSACPMSLLLARKGVDATVTVAHSRTPDLVGLCREADILIAAAGMARMITADHVRPGAAVVDVGVSRTEAGIVGDVDFDAVQAVAGAITPMPGGTGPMTIACLLENTLDAARMLGAV